MSGLFRFASCGILLILFASLGCEPIPSAIPSPTPYLVDTPTPTPKFTPTPFLAVTPTVNTTPTRCRGFVWAHGTVSPEFISQVQDAMRTAGVEGSVGASTLGETDTCGNHYGAEGVDYHFTVQVGELDTREDIVRKLAIVREISWRFVDQSPAHSVGRLGVTFMSGELGCTWRFEDELWEFFSVIGANGAGCRLPANDRTRPLAAALTALSTDLACESFTMTADMLSVSLFECERSEGANRYTVNVTFAYDRQETGGSTCFHGWPAHERYLSGTEPVKLTEGTTTFYEQGRSFEWTTRNDLTTFISERIRGGAEATFPLDTGEKVYLRALQEGAIPGAGPGCR